MHRSPITGRHFECFSEDPHLTSRAAVAYIRGVQKHAAACAKHFVGNDQEADRGHSNSVIGARALHEVYLLPFEAAVREAGAQAIMPGYNRLNGEYCAENKQLLQGVLRDTWLWEGFVISDWWANRSTMAAVRAGLNVEMPGIEPRYYAGHLLDKVKAKEVSEDLLDERCRPILQTLLRYPRQGTSKVSSPTVLGSTSESPSLGSSSPVSKEAKRALLHRAAAASLVLLKNQGDVLPFQHFEDGRKSGGLRSLAVIGPNAAHTTIQGGGSSRVHPEPCQSILEALRAALGPRGVEVRYEQGCPCGDRPTKSPELEGLKRMGGCDASGQPIHGHNEAKFLDAVLSIASWCSQKEWFRARCMPVLRCFGLRHTDPGEAGRNLISGEWGSPTDEAPGAPDGCAMRLKGLAGGAGAAAVAAFGFGAASAPMLCLQAALGGGAIGFAAAEVLLRRMIHAQWDEDQSLERAVRLAAEADATVLVLGTDGFWECEGLDQPHMRLPRRQDELARRCIEAAKAAGRPLAVVLNVGSPKELAWLDSAQAVLLSYFGGEGTGSAVAGALLGSVTPAGRLPTTWPKRLDLAPAVAASIAAEQQSDGEGGAAEKGSQGDVIYHEGLHLGYRGLADLPAPLFHFGHGLSYTTFGYSDFEVKLLSPPGATCFLL
ncbi:unnamed protein product [Polarella glacialis]|uniref:beta-glucosidase n=1 Tax=Polarella glacialis TaxID=89957 RepID=A0A813KPF7_POLGL|nr:unnamed protein product [Polarella glacialis]